MCENNHLATNDPSMCKIFCKPVMNLAISKPMFFEIQRMPSKVTLAVSGRVICSLQVQIPKATNGQKNDSAEESIIIK